MKNLKNIIFAFVMSIASFQISYAESIDSQLVNVAGSCNVERVKYHKCTDKARIYRVNLKVFFWIVSLRLQ